MIAVSAIKHAWRMAIAGEALRSATKIVLSGSFMAVRATTLSSATVVEHDDTLELPGGFIIVGHGLVCCGREISSQLPQPEGTRQLGVLLPVLQVDMPSPRPWLSRQFQ